MSEITRANRRFEKLLFAGVPETPKGIYESDSNGRALSRTTGEFFWGAPRGDILSTSAPIEARVWFDADTMDLMIEPVDPSEHARETGSLDRADEIRERE